MKGTRGLGGVGEIVQVQGGHILRPTGPKDRHSKIYTSKGPKDRRVRLSAHTAIKFYDVQDRLGYDRSTRAVDWLINKAKAAIDELNNNEITLVEQQTETPNYGGYPLLQANNNIDLSNQGNFQRMENGWNRDGFVMNTQEISQQGLLFSHELPFSQRGQHFELGFGNYGEE